MKERLQETNRMRRLMGLPLITEQTDNKTENYTVKKGDSLSLIAKSFNKNKKCKIAWEAIYDINKKVIEDAQNKNGGVKTCSDSWCKGRETPNPNLIFPGTVLRIPTGSCGDKVSNASSVKPEYVAYGADGGAEWLLDKDKKIIRKVMNADIGIANALPRVKDSEITDWTNASEMD
jgi:LysM repeat protein